MKTIKLKKFALGRYDDHSPYPMGDLVLKIEGLPKYASADIRFIAKINGKEITKLAIAEESNVITIPQGQLECGELTCAVVVYSHGQVVEEYDIEPLIITDVNGQFFSDPFIHAMTTALREVKEQVKELDGKYTKFEEATNQKIEALNGAVGKLIKFAEMCIKVIPYISNYKFTEDLKND